jgi:tRNA pseudouridine38-40 synthase
MRNSTPKTQIALVLEYEGTNYCGFQFQTNVPTVQDEIEKALLKLTGDKIRVKAASRTDTGVHAKGQVISFKTDSVLKLETFVNGLNFYLPQDIAVKASYKINDKFSVQRDAVSRQYSYFIWNRSTRSPLKRSCTYHVSNRLDVWEMNQASQILVGKHDLASFVTELSRSTIKSTLRTVYAAKVENKGDLVIFNIVAKSFLPHQVRNTVGTLIRVGLGKINIDNFKTIMDDKKPGLAGPTVPAQGLFLMNVTYPEPLGEHNEDL